MGGGDEGNCQISHASLFFHVPNIHIWFCLWMVDIEVKPQASCNICSVTLMIINHHSITTSISCKATSITSLSLASGYVTWYWQPAATRSFWAAYNFWKLDQLTSAVVTSLLLQWYPPYCVIRTKKLPSFLLVFFLSTEQFKHDPDSKFRYYNLKFMLLPFTCLGL